MDGTFWRGDHTFQAASRIRSGDGRKDYGAIYSVMNEWSQIVGQWAVGDTTFQQYELGLADVLKRYETFGYQVWKTSLLDCPLCACGSACCKSGSCLGWPR